MSRWLGHQSLSVCGRPPVLGVGEGIAGFSLSLPCAAAESGATGHPASALRSTPCGLSGAPFSGISLIGFLSAVGCVRGSGVGAGGAGAPVEDLRLVDREAAVLGGGQAGGVADRAVHVSDGA